MLENISIVVRGYRNLANPQTPVLIVGAGPAGLTLACDLLRRGIAPMLIERLPGPATGSKGKGLQPRTLEILDDLGIIDAIVTAGRTYPKVRFYKDGEVIEEREMYVLEPTLPVAPYPNAIMLPQWKTEALLRERLAALGGRIEFATTLTGFAQQRDHVLATIAGAGGTSVVEAQFVVGTDGGRSTVRKVAGIALEGTTPALDGILVADVLVDGLSRDVWHYWTADDQPSVGLCPLPSTEAFQFTALVGAETNPELTLATLQAAIEKKSRRDDVRLHSLGWISLFRPNVRMAGSFREGRVFIAGDAAHVHPPAGGQGLNTSVQDAYNLGWKLAAVLNGAPLDLLDTYQEERQPIAAEVLQRSERLYRTEVKGEETAFRRGKNEAQLLLNYRGRSLLAGKGRGSLQPGDRMPNLRFRTAGKTRQLFDVLRGPHATILALSAPVIPDSSALRVVELDAHAVEDGITLLGEGQAYVFVRPDGYIGAIESDIAALNNYTARLLPARTRNDRINPLPA